MFLRDRFEPAWRAPGERLSEVVEHLVGAGVAGRRIALQQAGDGDNGAAAMLRSAGAEVVEVPVYRWTVPVDERPAHRLIDAACRGALHAVTFTTAPAVEAFFRFAADRHRTDVLLHALNGSVTVACVGPVCADAARAVGVQAPVEPRPARLGAMVRALTERLRRRHVVLDAAGHVVEAQGSTLVIDGVPTRLGDPEGLLLETLANADGRVVDHRTLMHAAWPLSAPDAHRLEAAVARLRRRLGTAAPALTTVRRRGYRLDVARRQPHRGDDGA
jgi:uroporphyrinogen-III synthase